MLKFFRHHTDARVKTPDTELAIMTETAIAQSEEHKKDDAEHKKDDAETQQSRHNQRLLSHTIIDVRPFRSLPLFTQSSHLLDISNGGVLLEFITVPRITEGKKYWMIGHLTPLGINDVHQLQCYLQCRWVDDNKCRVGGLFVDLDEQNRRIVELVLQRIREKSQI